MRTTLFALLLSLSSTACLRSTEYHCSGDGSCGAGGVCETSGFCSFIDNECSSGRRYNSSAGNLAGSCTTGGTMMQEDANDPGIDMGMQTDTMMADTPVAVCPNGYATITGGNAGHMYKLVTTSRTWPAAEADCQATTTKAHLTTPDDITEHTAIDTLVGTGRYWIGVTDAATELTWLSVLGTAQTYLPWETGAPSTSGPEEDCVESNPAQHEFNDERCTNTSQQYVCECAP